MGPVPADVARSLSEPKAFEVIFERHFGSVHRSAAVDTASS
jgi:hypothetical protein